MRDRFEHDGSGRNPRAVPNLDIAEDLRASADQHAVANFRVPVARLLARAAEGHFLQDRDVILDQRSLAHDEPRGMIKKNSTSDAHGRIDIGLKHRRRAALEIISKILTPSAPEPKSQSMRLNRVKTLKVKHRFKKAVGRGVAINRRHDVGTECLANRRVSFKRVGVSSPDHLRGDLWTVE